MRLIDADALMKLAHNHINGTVDCNDIARFPTVDAVEVVRCKDCVHAGAFPNAYAERRFEGGMNCYLCRGDDGYGMPDIFLATYDAVNGGAENEAD